MDYFKNKEQLSLFLGVEPARLVEVHFPPKGAPVVEQDGELYLSYLPGEFENVAFEYYLDGILELSMLPYGVEDQVPFSLLNREEFIEVAAVSSDEVASLVFSEFAEDGILYHLPSGGVVIRLIF